MLGWFKPKPKIGLVAATAFAVGAMIGGGVFVLTGLALKQAGPAALLSFLMAGVIVLLSAFSFVVIASKAEAKDSGYAYVGQVLSPIWGFMTSWCFYLAGIIGAAFVLNAFGAYVHEFIWNGWPALIWALLGALILTLVNFGPASEIGKVETLLVVIKLLILGILIGFGLTHLSSADLVPFTAHGGGAVLKTSASLFIAFLGFNVITNISGDIDQPQRNVPRAILLSMIIVTVFYAGVVLALLAAGLTNFNEAAVGRAAQVLIGPLGGGLIVAGALIATLSSANANILGSSEIMVRLAARKEVPSILGKLYRGHPFVSVLLGAVLYSLLIVTGQTRMVIGLANATAIVALIIVNLAAARALMSPQHDGLRLPLGPMIPILGIIGAAWQFVYMPASTLVIAGLLILLGTGVYWVRADYLLPREQKRAAEAVAAVNGPIGRSLKR